MNTTSASACLEVMIIFIHLRNGMNIFLKKQQHKENKDLKKSKNSHTLAQV